MSVSLNSFAETSTSDDSKDLYAQKERGSTNAAKCSRNFLKPTKTEKNDSTATKISSLFFKDFRVHGLAITAGLTYVANYYVLNNREYSLLEAFQGIATEEYVTQALFGAALGAFFPSPTLGNSIISGGFYGLYKKDIKDGIAFGVGEAVGSLVRNSTDLVFGWQDHSWQDSEDCKSEKKSDKSVDLEANNADGDSSKE
jgi:hypothetical protein